MNKASVWNKLLVVLHRIFLAAFYIPLRLTMGLYYLFKFNIHRDVPRDVRGLRPPYLVLADHLHSKDMFFNGLSLRYVIHWVAADANFRTPFMKFVMTVLAGAIPKSKNRSDMVTLYRMKLLSEMGCVIGVYHEGERTWDGVNLPPMKGTDKLIRFLKIPVVYAHLQGGYFDNPRWSWTYKGYRISFRYEILIDKDEVESLPLGEISRRIIQAGTYDEWADQKEIRNPIKGGDRAEHVEVVCFLCPDCRSVNTLASLGNDFSCSACGLSGSINSLGTFDWSRPPGEWPGGTAFETIRDWNLWQHDYYRERIRGMVGAGAAAETLFWEDLGTVRLIRGKWKGKRTDMGLGNARFYGDRIEFESQETHLVMPLNEISSFSVFMQQQTEFYHNKSLHQFNFSHRSVSGYKWLMLFRLITELRS